MKKIVLLFALLAGLTAYDAAAQTEVDANLSLPISTDVDGARYEFVQSMINSKQAFLVDKFTGDVWRYKSIGKDFELIKRDRPDRVVEDKINYQLYLSSENSKLCFLLNIHTGEMWRYTKDGDRKFRKMELPRK